MQYIILDMEWNQSFSRKFVFRRSTRLVGEVVQMGAVKLDGQFRQVDTFEILVAPKYYTQMNKQVSRLTGIKNEDLREGLPFKEAFARFRDWCGEDFIFLTWGYDDIPILRSNMQIHGLDVSWIPETYNVQRVFDQQITREKRQYALADAMGLVGEQPLDVHDALCDALNTALVCRHLDLETGLAQYQGLQMARIRDEKRRRHRDLPFPAEQLLQDDFESTYRTKRSAIADRQVNGFVCPECGQRVECREWVEQNSEKSVALAACKDGNRYFIRLKFARDEDGMYRVRRAVYALNDNLLAYYRDKVERRDQRRLRRVAAYRRKKENAAQTKPAES